MTDVTMLGHHTYLSNIPIRSTETSHIPSSLRKIQRRGFMKNMVDPFFDSQRFILIHNPTLFLIHSPVCRTPLQPLTCFHGIITWKWKWEKNNAFLPGPAHMEVCRTLVERRPFDEWSLKPRTNRPSNTRQSTTVESESSTTNTLASQLPNMSLAQLRSEAHGSWFPAEFIPLL